MPYAPHLRLTMSGRLMGNTGIELEAFSVRLNLTDPTITGSTPYGQDMVDDMGADCRAFWLRSDSRISSAAVLDQVKLARIGADGKYTDDPFLDSNDTPTPGGGGLLMFPLQVAFVVSLDTDRRGPSGKGRVFLPTPTLGLYPDLAAAEVAPALAVAASLAQLITDINNAPGLDVVAPEVVIASSKGFLSPVTSVRAGRVFDTVRSRRTSLAESYSTPVGVS
uniref:Uncharacterized protein n=1 Tax=uncultured prokaryote TaxID=198431 RepID=A0A0H5Q277_9ZZZZ|nr:hypothetical protein [uncultured prokaryote]